MTTEQLNNTSVEELALEAQDAIGDGIKTGDNVTIEGGLSGSVEVLDAGHSWVWDIRNGDRSKVNNNMLRSQLGKLDPDTNQRVFTTNSNYPGMPKPVLGSFKCVFHKDAENRAELDRLGHPVCKKSNLISPTEVENHARNRHPREWKQIYDAEQKIKDDRRAQIEELQLARLLAETPAPVAAAPAPAPVQPVQDAAPAIESPEEFRTCPKCEDWTNDTPKLASRRMSFFHHNKKHD